MSLVVGPHHAYTRDRELEAAYLADHTSSLDFGCTDEDPANGSGSKFGGYSSDTSSSIGKPDDDDDDVSDDDEVESTLSLGSLEDSLPIKRGLSKHYGGKSKSFGNLAQVKNVDELVKSENPFNKRRRTLLALNLHDNKDHMNTMKKKSGFYSHNSCISMPLLPLSEAADDDDENDESSDECLPTFRRFQHIQGHPPRPSLSLHHTSISNLRQ